jgi:hypothetical protein
MTIVPDTKDWTWVLERPCPECGFDSRTVELADVPRIVRDSAAVWPAVLAAPDAARRPEPAVWSPLEYGCHVRDVFRLFRRRLEMIMDEDGPLFLNWDQDATAVEERYGEQDPARVAAELAEAADQVAAAFEAVPPEAATRTGRRSDGASFTVETFGRYFVHDVVHHRYDVTGRPAG